MNTLFLAAAVACFPSVLPTDGPYDYLAGSETMEGHLVTPGGKGPHPLVLIVHDWDGLDAYEISRARQTASELNAVALAVDIYGKDTRPKTTTENGQFAGKYYGDRQLYRARLRAAYEAGIRLPNVDAKKVIVMGYCFGGAGALELARTGVDLVGAVSFHGGLSTSIPTAPGTVTCRVLAFHAANDPAVPREQFNSFLDECREAKIRCEVHVFNLAAHAFTKPGGKDYSAEGDRRSWKLFKDFYVEVTES